MAHQTWLSRSKYCSRVMPALRILFLTLDVNLIVFGDHDSAFGVRADQYVVRTRLSTVLASEQLEHPN